MDVLNPGLSGHQARQSLVCHNSTVAILLCTYQGQSFLAQQLDSIEAQSHAQWQVWVSDDGSKDDTHNILLAYQRRWPKGRMTIHTGPAKGFAANFLSLTCRASIGADYYAFADQDDVWESDKLSRAVQWLQTVPQHVPALYCGRTRLVDVNNKDIGLSPLFSKPPSFANALMQNIGGGNTMVFNHAARRLLCEAGDAVGVVSHDWWVYMLVSGCGGHVFYDPKPTLRYRQHGTNLVGQNNSWLARIKRVGLLWQGRFRRWNDANIAALQAMQHRLTPANQQLLSQFAHARQQPVLQRLWHIKHTGIHRQTPLGNLGLVAAAILGKI
jgi:glycosyltransferase involved in cell wall biosynthesis